VAQRRDTRLARLAAGRAEAGSAAAARRRTLRARVAVCAMLRPALIAAGIDPADVPALRLGDAAMAELAGLGDAPELGNADAPAAAHQPGAIDDRFAAKIFALGRPRPGRGAPGPAPAPDPARASLAELFAWWVVRPVYAGGSRA
jgi:hypothetical protein